MRNLTLAGIAAALALGLMAGPMAASAQAPWSQQGRSVQFESDEKGFRFVSTRTGHEDQLSGAFSLADARFRWAFFVNGSAAPVASEFLVDAVIEWRDEDQDGRFGVGDAVVSRRSIAAMANETIEVLPRPPGGRVVHAHYPFPGSGPGPLDPLTGRRIVSDAGLTLSFHVLESAANVGALAADPTRVPLEVQIERWPRTGNDTRLGLELRLQSEGTMAIVEDAWRANHTIAEHRFAWTDRYAVNGTQRPARVLAIERPGGPGFGAAQAQATLLSAYDHGNVLHSLSFGTDLVSPGSVDMGPLLQRLLGDPGLYVAGLAGAAIVVAATAARKIRRRT